MSSFYINNTQYFTTKTDIDHINIKSVPRPYKVWLDSSAQDAYLCYEPGDIFLIDNNVYNLYYNTDLFSRFSDSTFLIDAIEKNKSIETVLSFTRFLLDRNFTKKSKIIVIGGGITQDIAAFTAAVYKRGIKWVYFPTTLLSMCDSCIGGKTGINFNDIKNQLALFSSPSQIYLAPHYLSTLSDGDIKSGLGECLKLFRMAGVESMNLYRECVDKGNLVKGKEMTLIKEALEIKKAVIEEDEFETGNRTALNYGHTIGHALEVATNYKIPHGKAVAIGCAVEDNICKSGSADDYINLVHELVSDDVSTTIDYDKVLSLVKKDRKVMGDKIKIAASEEAGKVSFVIVNLDEDFREKMITSLGAFFE